MYEQSLTHEGHTRRFLISALGPMGWEVREEQDSHVIQNRVYDDWHRVERARSIFQVAISELEQAGWVVERTYSTKR
jgi:hypothetical protein